MIRFITQLLTDWNIEKNQRIKLQQAYFLLMVSLTLVAGVSVLINSDMSRTAMIMAAFVALTYVCNGVAWVLLEAFVAPRLPRQAKSASSKKVIKKR